MPPAEEYVLIKYDIGTREEKAKNFNCAVAMLMYGMAMEERDSLPDGDRRKIVWSWPDEESCRDGCNWGFWCKGAVTLRREVTHWMKIPSLGDD